MRIPIGPVLLEASVGEGVDDTAFARLLDGFHPGSETTRSRTQRGGRVRVRLAADPAATASDRLEPVALRYEGAGRYRNVCGEDAIRLEGFEPGGHPVAEAWLRPPRLDPRLRAMRTTKVLRAIAPVALLDEEAVLVHGCAMVPPGSEGAVLFLGGSGDGKTTMRRRLRGWRALADDTVLLRAPAGEAPSVAGTPFPGLERLPRSGASHPLAGLVTLVPGVRPLELRPRARAETLRGLLARTIWPIEGDPRLGRLLDLGRRAVEGGPAAELRSELHDDPGPELHRWLEANRAGERV